MVFTEGVAVLTCFADTIFVRYKKSIWNFCAFVNITSNKYVGNLLDSTNIYLEHYSNKEDDDDVLSFPELTQSSSSSILHLTAISTTSRLGPSISLIRHRIAESTLEFWIKGIV